MELRPLLLASTFVVAAYLAAWFARLVLALYHWTHKNRLARNLSATRFSLNPNGRKVPWIGVLLALSGAIFGWAIVSWVGALFMREWLLLVLLAIGIFGDELRPSVKDLNLLAVLTLIDGLYNQREIGIDVFDRLARVVDELPAGEVQKAAREALQRRRSGLPVQECMRFLHGLNNYLDEMVFNFRLAGWQANSAFDLSMRRLLQRAGKKWDRTSRSLQFIEQSRPFLIFGQAAILAVLAILVLGEIPMAGLVWPSYALLAWTGIGLILAGWLLYVAYTRVWLRRFLAVTFLSASLIPLWGSARASRLIELQFHEVTYSTAGVAEDFAGHAPAKVPGLASNPPTILTPNQMPGEFSVSCLTPTLEQSTLVVIQMTPVPNSSHHLEVEETWPSSTHQPR